MPDSGNDTTSNDTGSSGTDVPSETQPTRGRSRSGYN
ncbi:hypothetical protein ANO14919_107560 [Xylariales sp. No.14919]|nr:hypothetical protein ANO14919_107560 [Xylariales sp. No.14919]